MSRKYKPRQEVMTGKVKCGACTQPLRDHKGFDPCPYYDKARQSPK